MGDGLGPCDGLDWQRSRFCVGEFHCVEWAYGDSCVYLRNSQKPDLYLCLTPAAWRCLILRIRSAWAVS
ncbi:DUF397 domain-containing protein [Actinoplanes sichuanensis]|uniref:DUF397 domain-containing protein n=1 Tax=Actinoplanes sichuanensis TaxID=512349 RepID=A0ABW4A9V1_9ACTN